MIQEPLTNLEKILQEPVFNISGQAPALKRLTVKLVALEPSSLNMPPVKARGFMPIAEANGPWPVAEANEFTPAPESSDESEEDADWFYSNDETPIARFYTPQPVPEVYTPPVERARISDPDLPIFSPDLAYLGGGAMGAVAFGGIAELGGGLGIRSNAWERGLEEFADETANAGHPGNQQQSLALSVPPLQSTLQGASQRIDPTLFWLTALLLLGILGGIGFGYLLTFVYQG